MDLCQSNQSSAFCATLIQLSVHVGYLAVSKHDFEGIECSPVKSTVHLGNLDEAWLTRLRLSYRPGSCVVLLGSQQMQSAAI